MLTREERSLNELLGRCFVLFRELPVIHPADEREFMQAIHQAQNIVLSRPSMRELGFETISERMQIVLDAFNKAGYVMEREVTDGMLPSGIWGRVVVSCAALKDGKVIYRGKDDQAIYRQFAECELGMTFDGAEKKDEKDG